MADRFVWKRRAGYHSAQLWMVWLCRPNPVRSNGFLKQTAIVKLWPYDTRRQPYNSQRYSQLTLTGAPHSLVTVRASYAPRLPWKRDAVFGKILPSHLFLICGSIAHFLWPKTLSRQVSDGFCLVIAFGTRYMCHRLGEIRVMTGVKQGDNGQRSKPAGFVN